MSLPAAGHFERFKAFARSAWSRRLKPSEVTLWLIYESFADPNGEAYPSIAQIAELTGEKCLIQDGMGGIIRINELPVSQVDMEWMGRIRNRIASRPMSKHIYTTPKPISIECVKNWLMTLAMAFDWLDRTPRIGWTAPHHRWHENFILSQKQEHALRTPAERDEQGNPKPVFTLDELGKIYRSSTRLGKKYLLMGLMLGWAQEAINSFRRCHLIKIKDEYYIDRKRGKTGVEGCWLNFPTNGVREVMIS